MRERGSVAIVVPCGYTATVPMITRWISDVRSKIVKPVHLPPVRQRAR
jgi:hypothetical protein